MPLKLLNNLLLMIPLLLLGYADVLHAGECGVLRFLANKSNGVEITGNKCPSSDGVALGTAFNLMSGARLWFKSLMDADTLISQGICQNRSSKSIRINVDSNQSPWVKPIGLGACSPWTGNKMNCEGKDGQTALTCVIAATAPRTLAKNPEERTTSVRIRSLKLPDAPDNKQIFSAMQADVDLCRAIHATDAPINISWQVETDGRVATVNLPELAGSQNDAEHQFVDCLSTVIKAFPYPPSSQSIWLSNQF